MPHSATLQHYRQAFFSRTIIAWNHSDNSATLQHYRHAFFFKNYHSLEPLRQQHNKPPPPLRIPSGRTNASGCRTLLARCGTQTHVDPTLRFINTLLHCSSSTITQSHMLQIEWQITGVCVLLKRYVFVPWSTVSRLVLFHVHAVRCWQRASAGGHHTSL